MILRRLLYLLLTCATATACQSAPIYGAWEAQDTGAGTYFLGHYAYMESGDKCTLLFDAGPFGTTTLAYMNRWELEDDVLTITYGQNNSPNIRAGHVSRSRIEVMTKNRMVYRVFEPVYPDIEPEKAVRLPDVKPERICQVVRTILALSPAGSQG